ncbi:MAG TPA: sodium:solute symporter family protein [Acidobacteriota bacterium]|jgi:SSS family solute:Na+ symporter
MSFSFVDWSILTVYLFLVFYLGILGRKYIKKSADFLVANRTVGPCMGTISLLGAEIGILSFAYFAEMGFLYGYTAFVAGLIPPAVYFFLGKTGFVIKRFCELELVTVPQYFEKRYGRNVRILTGILMAVGGVLNFGVFPIIEATFLNILTGIPQAYIIGTMSFLLTMVLLYTALGGMISVLLTSYVQYIVKVMGMILISLYCFDIVGWSRMVEAVTNRMGESGFNPFKHPSFGVSFILWQVLSWLAALTTWAPVVARLFSSENAEVGQKVFRWTGWLFLGRSMLPFIWGIAALAYVGTAKVIAIQAMPLFLKDILPTGIKGLIVAAMLAASMSTNSSYLLAWSSVISQDVVIPLMRRPVSAKMDLIINQITVVVLAVFIIVWGLFYVIPGATYFYLFMTANIFLAGTFWALVGGLYWRRAHRIGAYSSLILGASCTLFYFFIPNPQEWSSFIGMASYVLAFVGMVAGSLVGTAPRSLIHVAAGPRES